MKNLYLFCKGHIYYVQFVDDAGHTRRKSHRCKKKSDALIAFRAFEESQEKQTQPLTVSQFTKKYKETKKGILSNSTITVFENAATHFLAATGSDLFLEKLTPEHWDLYKAYLVSKGKSVSANTYCDHLRTALNSAVAWRHLAENPFTGLPKLKAAKTEKPIFTLKELQKILKAINDMDIRDAVELDFYTGLRFGELIAIRWDWILRNGKQIDLFINCDEQFTTKGRKSRVVACNPVSTISPSSDLVPKQSLERDETFFNLRGSHFKNATTQRSDRSLSRRVFCAVPKRAGAGHFGTARFVKVENVHLLGYAMTGFDHAEQLLP